MIKLFKTAKPDVLAKNAEDWTKIVLGKIAMGEK